MVIVIFARERMLAKALTQEALSRGHKVRCYQGRLADYAVLRESVSGADAAVCALCYPPEPTLRPEQEAGVRNVIYALEEEGIARLAALMPAEQRLPTWKSWFGRRFRAGWKRIGQAMRAARRPWMLVPQKGRIYRREDEVARILLDALESGAEKEKTYA